MADRIVVVGSIALDTLHTPHGSAEDCVGGSASYAAFAASYHAPVNLVAVVGTDFPQAARELFGQRKVDTEGLEVVEGQTFRWGGRYHEDMNRRDTLFTELNVFEDFHPKLPDSYRSSEVVFLANIHPALQMEVLEQVDAPRFTALDTMNLWIDIARDDLVKALGCIDLLFLNDEEAMQLSGEGNISSAVRALKAMGPKSVVVKKGEHGAVLFADGNEPYVQPTVLLESVVDPTGAGDAFAGGFLGHVARSGDASAETLRQAMVQGTVTASFTTEEFGPDRLVKLPEQEIDARREVLRRISAWPFA
ncbi:sugar kinase [bacterium]|nr:MAG: sugar kinase [bacterium]RKZ18515.1 MAG: sugar kinase [bacterium]